MSLPPEVGIEEEEEEEEVALSQQLQELIEAKQAEKIEWVEGGWLVVWAVGRKASGGRGRKGGKEGGKGDKGKEKAGGWERSGGIGQLELAFW